MHLNFFIDLATVIVAVFVIAVMVAVPTPAGGEKTTLTSGGSGGANVRSVRLNVTRCGSSSDGGKAYSIVGHDVWMDV
jgi:hypothetical protein